MAKALDPAPNADRTAGLDPESDVSPDPGPGAGCDIGDRLVPALLARDLVETIAFYRNLGFELAGCHPDAAAPTWAELCRDGVVLQFHSEPPHGTPPAPVCSGTFYVYPEDVRSLAEEFRGKVELAWGPEVMDYGMREFGIRDPNGYYLAFTEPA